MRSAVPEASNRRYWAGFAALVAVVIPAIVLVRPGTIVDDGRAELLVDPTAALLDGLRIWDPDRALGTVAAGDVRRLWPLGAYHWLMEAARVPDWLAQRLWLAGLLLAAAGGVLAVARAWRWRPAAALAAAAAYALSPIVVTGTLDAEALLPWAGLPWLLHLAVQALRHRGWRYAVGFGIVLAASGSGDATDAALLLAVPLAWIAHALWISRDTTRARAITTVAKLGVAVAALNTWWIVALTVQSTNGVDAARFGVPPDVIASTSSAAEVVRGLGEWRAYRPGVAERYTQQPMLLLASFVVPVAGIIALGVSRWRYRAFAIGLVVAGTILAAAAFDGGPASPLRAVLDLASETRPGLALRGLEGAVVVVVLALSLGVGALVGAAGEQSVRRGALGAAAAAVISIAALPALWLGEAVPPSLPGGVASADARALAARLDAGDGTSRVLELPGRIGRTDGSASPLQAVLDRPHAVRQDRPAGSAASTDLLRALDDRVQRGTLPPTALAPLARLLGVGDVVVRTDDSPAAAALIEVAPGLGAVERFGDLVTAPVEEPVGVVRSHDDSQVVLLSGSGDGIVDAAAAGLLQGDELIRYSSSVTDDPEFVRAHLVDQRTLIVTDTNRIRAERWTGVEGVHGFTEAPDAGLLADDPFDQRLRVQAEREGIRTLAERGPVTARATTYGPTDRYRPDQRPALAVDGDPATAWVLPAATSPGEELEVTTADPVDADSVQILQRPAADGTAIAQVVLRLDGEDAMEVDLTPASRRRPGQRIDLGGRPFRTLSIEIRSLTGPATASSEVAISEVDVAGLRGSDWVRMPSDLLDAAGFRSTRYPLALVQTRLRGGGEAGDEERALRRIVDLATTRTYRLSGRARTDAGVEGVGAECREDLVAIDDRPVAVRVVPGTDGDALRIEGCDPDGIVIPGGERRFSTSPGGDTGVHVDQLVWSSAPVGVAVPEERGSTLALQVTSREATAVSVAVDGASRGTPFWIILGQSHDPGWSTVETEDGMPVQVDGPHLVNGYANGFLVTPAADDVAVDLRFVPQNRMEVALLFSGLAVLLALVLALPRPQPLGVAPSHRQEPLRRLRAFTYEGALPTKREATTVAAIGAGVGTLVGGPLVGVVVGALGGYATRREGWRPAFTLLPGVLLGGTAVALVLTQIEDRAPHGLSWPAQFGWAHVTTLTAVLLLGLDVVIDHVWRRGSLLE